MRNNQKILSLLGFAQKSRKLISGEAAVKALLKKEQIYLIILSEELSENRIKHWSFLAKDSDVKVYVFGKKIELGIAIGQSPRSIIGVTDWQLAEKLIQYLSF